MDSELVSFVLRSKNRKKTISLLDKEPLTASQLKEKTHMYESHVSRTIKELRDKELIYCKNPKDRRYRFYELTLKGKKALKDAKKVKE